MERILPWCCAIAFISTLSATVAADDLESGLSPGQTMISMPIEKIAGADDGVDVGDTICYT